MGANKPWKRQAKRIWGYCYNNWHYYCNDCPKSAECMHILGWGGCVKPIALAMKHAKENRIRKHEILMGKRRSIY
ncbi:MAG: hypothetical protein E7214_08240 [Clostridium sp.]|nr:hypothetical protein [Clostridium sp.]